MNRRRLMHLPGTAALLALAPRARAGAASDSAQRIKPQLTILSERPLNAETPAHLLDEDFTTEPYMFVRNNGALPESTTATGWRLRIEGEACERPTDFTLEELGERFEAHTYALTIECGGNGRAEFFPPVAGNQFTTGAVSCARWEGVRVADVLQSCGIADTAKYLGYYGRDRHLSGDPNKVVISRGVPIDVALRPEALLALRMNGSPIPAMHGGPLRLVVGGWPGSVSGKWVDRLVIRDRVHDGAKMESPSYRLPCEPVAPGTEVADDAMCIIEAMPVKSVITFPRSGVTVGRRDPFALRGHAWAGDRRVRALYTSLDFGATWQAARIDDPINRNAWQRFNATVAFPGPGYYEVWSRAEDDAGRSQPMVLPGWNPKGYLNNACHRIAVQVTA